VEEMFRGKKKTQVKKFCEECNNRGRQRIDSSETKTARHVGKM